MSIRYVIVDDAPFVREVLKALMSSLGHQCVGEADDGRQAIDIVLKTLPQLIFLDLVLPRKNGVEVRKDLKDHWPEAKVVACSTLKPEELPQPQDAELFDGYLVKPFDLSAVENILRNLKLATEVTP